MKYIHIAGTNGKGSVAAYIYNIIMAAGKRCGCFTSPHLVSPTERLCADVRCIGVDELDALLNEARRKRLPVNASLFAAQTAAALLWFERQSVEYAVLETGLGGRLDPTNYVQATLSILTAIDYDHMDVLGNRLEQIAYEKSGIIKAGVPVVCAPQHPDVMRVISDHCDKVGTSLITLSEVKVYRATLEGQTFAMGGQEYAIRALGDHQTQNAALAVLAARQFGLGEDAIGTGLLRTQIPCRTQYIKGIPDMLIDGAHNSASVDALLSVLKQHFPHRNKVLLFACMTDKDYAAMAQKLDPAFSRVFLTRVDAQRGADIAELGVLFPNATEIADPIKAFEAARQAAQQEEALLVAAGSFYLAGLIESRLSCK